jgi:nitrous-oxide reductase
VLRRAASTARTSPGATPTTRRCPKPTAKYDGQFLFINDKANPRLAVIDLRDFETKQIVVNPIFKSEHGGAFVSPNTEYVIEAAQYADAAGEQEVLPAGRVQREVPRRRHLLEVRPQGRPHRSEEVLLARTAAVLQDLSDAGKGPSDGWSFTNSFCSERYVGGIEKGRPPYEAGCSAKDTDYLHVINWKKAAELVAAGKAKKINGHNVLMMETAIKEGMLFLIPEPKSPHGVDVTPDGKFIVVSPASSTPTCRCTPSRRSGRHQGRQVRVQGPYGIPVIA